MKTYPHRFKNPHLNKLVEIHNLIGGIGDFRASLIGLLCPEMAKICAGLEELTLQIGKECGE